MSAQNTRKGGGLLVSDNDESPTSSQFLRKDNKLRIGRKVCDSRKFDLAEETINEALIDLYLSVKIRSNEEVSTV